MSWMQSCVNSTVPSNSKENEWSEFCFRSCFFPLWREWPSSARWMLLTCIVIWLCHSFLSTHSAAPTLGLGRSIYDMFSTKSCCRWRGGKEPSHFLQQWQRSARSTSRMNPVSIYAETLEQIESHRTEQEALSRRLTLLSSRNRECPDVIGILYSSISCRGSNVERKTRHLKRKKRQNVNYYKSEVTNSLEINIRVTAINFLRLGRCRKHRVTSNLRFLWHLSYRQPINHTWTIRFSRCLKLKMQDRDLNRDLSEHARWFEKSQIIFSKQS